VQLQKELLFGKSKNDGSSSKKSKRKSSAEVMSDAVNNLARSRDREFELHEKELKERSMINATLYTSMDKMLKCATTSEEINLCEKQIAALKKKVKSCDDPSKVQKYESSIHMLEDKHDKLLMLDNDSDSE
jgi:hypothetical protein